MAAHLVTLGSCLGGGEGRAELGLLRVEGRDHGLRGGWGADSVTGSPAGVTARFGASNSGAGRDLEERLDGVALHGLGELRGPQPPAHDGSVYKAYLAFYRAIRQVLHNGEGGRALDEGLDGSEVGAAADQGAAQELRRVLVYLPQLDHSAAR